MPLSTAYSICEAFGWERGVNHKWNEARIFYGIYTGLIVVRALVAMIPGARLFLLFLLVYELNGILLPIILILILRLANNRRLLGEHVNGPVANLPGITTAVILIALTALLLAGPLRGML